MAKPKKENTNAIEEGRDSLLIDIANSLNKDEDVAFFLDDQEDASQVTDFLSTGNVVLDLIISNRPNGGYPVGRITEITGLESCGKSLLSAHALAETQRRGGVAVYIDTEYAADPQFLQAIGVDTNKMLLIQKNTVEDIFDKIEEIVALVRKSTKDRLVTIVVDSVAAATTKAELATDNGKDGYATGKAIILSKVMRKLTEMIAKQRIVVIFVNQLRQKMGFVGFGDQFTTSGGKAIAYHSSVRLRMKSVGQIKIKDAVVGVRTKTIVVKNRMGPPAKSTEFNIFFDSGMDKYSNWVDELLELGILKNSTKKVEGEDGGKKKTKIQQEAEKKEAAKAKSLKFTIESSNREVIFERKDFVKLITDDQEAYNYLYGKLCDESIMKYKTSDTDMSDMVCTDDGSISDE